MVYGDETNIGVVYKPQLVLGGSPCRFRFTGLDMFDILW
jgi:hypothetical protein